MSMIDGVQGFDDTGITELELRRSSSCVVVFELLSSKRPLQNYIHVHNQHQHQPQVSVPNFSCLILALGHSSRS
jgi:hypothetical protein